MPAEKESVKIAAQNKKAYHDYFVEDTYAEYAEVVVDHNKDFKEIEEENLRNIFFTTKEECQAFCDYINGTEVLGYDYNVEGQLVAQREETE